MVSSQRQCSSAIWRRISLWTHTSGPRPSVAPPQWVIKTLYLLSGAENVIFSRSFFDIFLVGSMIDDAARMAVLTSARPLRISPGTRQESASGTEEVDL
jgi:hypothetical protein